MIETDRLVLRPLKMSDEESFCELFADPQVMKSSIGGTKTPEEVKEWLLDQIERSKSGRGIELLAVKLKSTAAIIGYCGLNEPLNIKGVAEVEIGYRLNRLYWGNGYATEAAIAVREYAFEKLKLNRLVALIEPINTRSVAVARKIGMSYETDVMLPEYDHPDYLYSMTRDEV
ncbi:MAG: GNAT family N-acetyltransferase [Pseudomonadota bacterium]